MDVKNITHKVTVKLTNAVFDDQSRYLKVEGFIRNRMNENRQFDLRNWVFRLDEQGHFLKPKTPGLPVVQLTAINKDGSSREESFTLIYKIEHPGPLTNVTIEYADQFTMTGQINRIIVSVPIHFTSGTVSSRG
jgi:hypothetical protein